MDFNDLFYSDRRFPEFVFRKVFDHYFFIADGYVRCSVENENFSSAIVDLNKSISSSNIIVGCLQPLRKNNIELSGQSTGDDYMDSLHNEDQNRIVLATDCLHLVIRDEKINYAIYADHQLDLAVMGVNRNIVRDVQKILGGLIFLRKDAYNDLLATFSSAYENNFPNYFNELENNYSPLWREP